MANTLKNVALWSLGVTVLSTAGIVLFLVVAGDGFYRWAADRALEGAIDRRVGIEGSFSLDIGMEPTLVVSDLWIENAPWAEPKEMVRVKHLEIQVALRPLLSGIVHVPRLVVEGLILELERGPDGTGNWQIARSGGEDRDSVEQKDLFYPLLEFISLKDAVITYKDRQSGRDTTVLFQSLQKDRLAADESFTILGEGRLNQSPFRINGRFGSLEEALAATAPYPLAMTLDISGLVAELKGTARNLPHAEGFDMTFTAQAPSIGQVLEAWESDLSLDGRLEASARLKGNLESLSVEDLVLEISEQTDRELQVKGSLSNLLNGRGLDLQFSATLGPNILRPMHNLPEELQDLVDGVARLDVSGQMTGDLEMPNLEKLQAKLEHRSGALLSLQGHMSLDLSGGGLALTGLETTSVLSLPGPALLEDSLGIELPALGAIHATSELTWKEDWITLSSFTAEAKSFGGLQLSAEGRLGKVLKERLDLDPQLNVSASIEQSAPLVSLMAKPAGHAESPSKGAGDHLILSIQQGLESLGLHPGPEDGIMGPRTRAAIEDYQAKHGLIVDGRATQELLRHLQKEGEGDSKPAALEPDPGQTRASTFLEDLPELGPIKASGQLSGRDGTYRLDNVRFTAGAKDTLWIEASGAVETLRPDQENPLEGLILTVTFALPSGKALSQLLPSEVLALREITGRFDARGSPEALSISELRIEAVGPDDLTAVAAGQVGALSLAQSFATKDLAVDLEVRSGSTESASQLVGFRLPDLGPVRAKAALGNSGNRLALTGIDASVGPEDKPSIHATGEIGDLLSLKGVAMSGNFEMPIASLLGPDIPSEKSSLGEIRGRFDLSDADGSLGLEKLNAETLNTDLFSFSGEGVFDDFAKRDELTFETSIKVPDPSTLGRQIGLDVGRLGAFSYEGQVSGSFERFLADGKAQIGQTEFSGTLTGSIKDTRPVLTAKLTSPVLHFADFGLSPETDVEKVDQKVEKTQPSLFSADPIPFAALRGFDLDLDVLLDHLEGVELSIDKAEAQVTLRDGLLKMEPLEFVFVGGSVVMHLVADAHADEPEISLRLAADDVDLGDLLAQVKVEAPLDGELNMLADLRAVGSSPRALSSSLEGSLDLAIARGHVRTSLLDLTAVNLVDWMVSDSALKGYSDLNCLIVRLDFRNGVTDSDKLIWLDTTNVTAVGKGNLDLREETIDIKVHPHARKTQFIELTTPFVIKGPLANPSVEVNKAGATARMVGELILTPVRLLGELLPLVNDHGKDAKNPCLTLQAGKSGE